MTTSMSDYNETYDDIGNDFDLPNLQGDTNLSNHEVNNVTIIQSSIIKY